MIIAINFLTILLMVFVIYKAIDKTPKETKKYEEVKHKWAIFIFILLLGACVRLIGLDKLPAGFNQDEASIAYDAYSLLENGYDRNGYVYPVYPVAWGGGHGPFYMYFSMIFMKLLGPTVFAFRLGNAILSVIALACAYFMLSKMFKTKYALIGMFVLAISPWNIMLSRWGLDANPLPSLFLIATTLLIYAIDKKSTWLYAVSAGMYSVSLYAYASAYIIVPLFLLFSIVYLLVKKKITVKQLIISGIVFVLIAIPLGTFWIINFLDLEEITTKYFSIPKLSTLRSESAFNFSRGGIGVWFESIIDYLELVILLKADDVMSNSIYEYGIYYMFAMILSVIGIVITTIKCKNKEFNYEYIVMCIFVAATIFTLMIGVNINRIHIIYIPILFFILKTIEWIGERSSKLLTVVIVMFIITFGCFIRYYVTDFNADAESYYFESFEDAVLYEKEKGGDKTTFVTPKVNGNYMLVMFYTKYDVNKYIDTVKFFDIDYEFDIAESFGNYKFYLPKEIDYTANYIVHNSELDRFDKTKFDITTFKYYSAVIPKIK